MPKDDALLGKMFEVVITTTGKHYLKGDILEESLVCAPSRPTPLPQGTVSGATEWNRKKMTEATVAIHTLPPATNTRPESSRLHESSSGSRNCVWLRVGDIVLLLVAALVLCAALLGHRTQLFTIWSR